MTILIKYRKTLEISLHSQKTFYEAGGLFSR